MMKQVLAMTAAFLSIPALAAPSVTGRYVRIEAPGSSLMSLTEIEAWAGEANLARKDETLFFWGNNNREPSPPNKQQLAALTNGRYAEQTPVSVRTPWHQKTEMLKHPWLELDLGGERPLDKLVLAQPKERIQHMGYTDRAIRLVSVLDGNRKVVWAAHFDVRTLPQRQDASVAEYALEPQQEEVLVGRPVAPMTTLLKNGTQWVDVSELLDAKPPTMPPDAEERLARFNECQSPAALEQLAKAFFARLDLTRPELADVRATFERGEFAAALDAYRDHFLKKLQEMTILHYYPDGPQPPPMPIGATALTQNQTLTFSQYDMDSQEIMPGAIGWAALPEEDVTEERPFWHVPRPVALALTRCVAGALQEPLLTAYRQTGEKKHLEKWAEITDDWGMNILDDLDRAAHNGVDLRNYFVFEFRKFNRHMEQWQDTLKAQPQFAEQLPGATLARFLMPIIEEYPPSYWWVCRRTAFNHTYNALNAATISARLLDDFHAGQRLDKENRQHWERFWDQNMTRDGSMIEIGDEGGHLIMQWMSLRYFEWMKRVGTPWLTPDFLAECETGWKNTLVLVHRHMTSAGRGHRFNRIDLFPYLWWPVDPERATKEVGYDKDRDNTVTMRQPDVAGIMQSVYGAGRERAQLPPERQKQYDMVTAFYGNEFEPPKTVSDFMPYTGLWYLRRSWAPDASFIHMMCQPKEHPSTNESNWNTSAYYYDYGQPLLSLSPVWIDGQPPFPVLSEKTYIPGSKTSVLSTASEFPVPTRWHTSAFCDYAESFFDGTYRTHPAGWTTGWARKQPVLGLSPITGARAERRVILLRPVRLAIVTDAVRGPDDTSRTYEIRQRFAWPEPDFYDETTWNRVRSGELKGTAQKLTLINQDAPGLTVHRFATAKLSWDKRGTPDKWWRTPGSWGGGASLSTHTGYKEHLGGLLKAETKGNLLMSALLEPHRTSQDELVKAASDLSTEGITGFAADLTNGAKLTWLSTMGEPRVLAVGALEARGESLLVYQHEGELTGLILGARSLMLAGEPVELPAADAEFSLDAKTPRAAAISFTPIHRPIQPVTFSPQFQAFTDQLEVTMTSATPNMEIRYTLDGSEPDATSTLYEEPITINANAFIRARAFRPGVQKIPFTMAGTDVTVISNARYFKRALKPAVELPATTKPGLRWELVDGNLYALFSHLNLPDVMPAKGTGETNVPPGEELAEEIAGRTNSLSDVSMRQGDGPFGVRYSGFLEIPEDGVWTFHAPDEYVGAKCEPGYDLRLWIDGEEWDIGQRYHGRGIWSVPLAKGAHRLLVTFTDVRNRDDHAVHNSGLSMKYPSPWTVWKGEAPVIEMSGPGLEKRPISPSWLRH